LIWRVPAVGNRQHFAGSSFGACATDSPSSVSEIIWSRIYRTEATAAHWGPAFFAYSANYLVDADHAIIVDVEATGGFAQSSPAVFRLLATARQVVTICDSAPERLPRSVFDCAGLLRLVSPLD
jgi:hypothetical protein